jgi:hypothetical protein
MAHMSFVIVEGAACATLVENDGVIWYHVVRPFSPGLEKTKRAAHPGLGVLPFHRSFGIRSDRVYMRQHVGGSRM